MIWPTECDECGKEFFKPYNAMLRQRAREIEHESGPSDAQEYLDEYLMDYHNSDHKEDR